MAACENWCSSHFSLHFIPFLRQIWTCKFHKVVWQPAYSGMRNGISVVLSSLLFITVTEFRISVNISRSYHHELGGRLLLDHSAKKTLWLTFYSTRYWNSHRKLLSNLQGYVETLFRWGGNITTMWLQISSSIFILTKSAGFDSYLKKIKSDVFM